MNDLGLTVAWLAVQVALMLVPALAIHALASRRGPAPGAWVAAVSLGLVVALVAAAFIPRKALSRYGSVTAATSVPAQASATPAHAAPAPAARVPAHEGPKWAGAGARALARLRLAWNQFEHEAAAPAWRVRTWGSRVALIALAGSMIGLLRLGVGLWAVSLCDRRGRRIAEGELAELLEELRLAMTCRRHVALCEVPGLTTPATAGWFRPIVLLPEDWRSWDDSERRAVLAHELAHIVRADYAVGLLARIAVILNFYHPLVRWLARRLQLQQELAADALGARFAGGRQRYLVALSRLALRQDGQSPCWPARAFLPAHGTLIRRIVMLRDEQKTLSSDRTWPRAQRIVTALGLLGLTLAVATLRGPARGAEEVPSPSPGRPTARAAAKPAEFFTLRDGIMQGAIIVRPAAAFRHKALAPLLPLFANAVMRDLAELEKGLKIDRSAPNFISLRLPDIEWATAAISFGRSKQKEFEGRGTIMAGGFVVRTVAPFDWLAFLRQWDFGFEPVHEGDQIFYRITGPLKAALGPDLCIYLADDRTAAFDGESLIRKFIRRGPAQPPAYLRGPDWERASRGLVAVALNNHDGAFAKHFDAPQPDDAVLLSLFKGVERWVLDVDDDDALTVRAEAICPENKTSKTIAQSIESLRKQGIAEIEHADSKEVADNAEVHFLQIATAFLTKLRIDPSEHALNVRAEAFATLADVTAAIQLGMKEEKDAQKRPRKGQSPTQKR